MSDKQDDVGKVYSNVLVGLAGRPLVRPTNRGTHTVFNHQDMAICSVVFKKNNYFFGTF